MTGTNHGRQDAGQSLKGNYQGKTNGGGAPRQRGLGQEGIPAEIHNNGDPDENQESDHRPRPGGRGIKAR